MAAALPAVLALAACETTKVERVEAAPAPPPEPIVTAPAPPVAPVAAPRPAPAAPPRSCVPRNLAAPPRYPDSDAALRAAGGAADRYQLLAAGRLQRQRRLEELERIVAGCRAAQP